MTENTETPPAADVLEAEGASCAILTPLIRSRIRGLESGSVLEIRTDDPTARTDIPAWSRLTNNELVAIVEDDADHTRFFLRKK